MNMFRCALWSEGSNPATTTLPQVIGQKNEEQVVHNQRLFDSWIEETIISILVAFAHGWYHCKLPPTFFHNFFENLTSVH